MTSAITLSDAVRAAVLYQLNIIHTAFPGIIVSYDYETQQASIQPALNKVYTNGTPTDPNIQPMPQLNSVPVVFPRSGGASLTFPINSGDTVLVICSERSIANWLQTGGQVAPLDPRKFDLSDAIAIPGLYPYSSPSPAPNNTDVVLQYQNSVVRINQNGDVKIDTSNKLALGSNVTEVLSVISSFLGDMITAIYAPPAGTLDPITAAALTVLQGKIDALRGTLP